MIIISFITNLISITTQLELPYLFKINEQKRLNILK
jgi:hypothetical protein